jgi:hypothetical protein
MFISLHRNINIINIINIQLNIFNQLKIFIIQKLFKN